MDAFDVHELIADQAGTEHSYTDFFRAERLSLGVAIWDVEEDLKVLVFWSPPRDPERR